MIFLISHLSGGDMMTKTNIKIKELVYLGFTVADLALKLGVTRQCMYNYLDDEYSCKLSIARKLEAITGISHQFFMYPVPTALQFLPGANNNGTK